jgi:protocatechuate 3,4-dioxygenase beta subunit
VGGRVVSEATGEPVAQATVYLGNVRTAEIFTIHVAPDGSFEFKNVPAGLYSMRVIFAAGYQNSHYYPSMETAAHMPVFALERREGLCNIEFRLRPAFRISGKVLDEDGNPLADPGSVQVYAWSELSEPDPMGATYSVQSRAEVGADGNYLLDHLGGRAVCVMVVDMAAAEKDDPYPPIYYPDTFSRQDAVRVAGEVGSTVKNVDIRLRKEGGFVLAGTVTDEKTGAPVPKALVVVHSVDMLVDTITAYSDQSGRYSIESLGPGTFLVHVDATPHGFVRTRKKIRFDSTAQKRRLDFPLRRGVFISGKFVNEDGKPFPDTRISGLAYIDELGPHKPPSWTGPANKHLSKGVRGNPFIFEPGTGDYPDATTVNAKDGSFFIPGMIPGRMLLRLEFAPEHVQILKVLHEGSDYSKSGLETKPGDVIEDVTIVVGGTETAKQ